MVTDIIVFDIETQKGFNDIPIRNNVWDLLMSTCVTYSYNKDEYKFWTYLKKDDLLLLYTFKFFLYYYFFLIYN